MRDVLHGTSLHVSRLSVTWARVATRAYAADTARANIALSFVILQWIEQIQIKPIYFSKSFIRSDKL